MITTAARGLVAAAWRLIVAARRLIVAARRLIVAARRLVVAARRLVIDVDVVGNGRIMQGTVLVKKSNANHAHAEGLCVEGVVDGRGS